MSLLTLTNATLHLGGKCLLDSVSWQIHAREKIAIVGRNGAGKSTLLKLIQGEFTLDSGQMSKLNGLKIAGLVQEVPLERSETVYDYLSSQDMEDWEVRPAIEAMASQLDLQLDSPINALSGGMKRRVLLAKALISKPDLLILDEPTNHLDINAIEWLENYLKTFHGSVLLVTHDRQFLSQVANCIIEIDRGKLSTYHCDFDTYLDRREANLAAEGQQNDLFDKRLADEEVWLRQGVKARRTRNEGRVKALKAMREAYKARRVRAGQVKGLAVDTSSRSGNLVIEATNISYDIPHKRLFSDVSLLITRGDKLGIIGPNGCGKTTLIRLLLKELTPVSGEVIHGTRLEVAYFDQLRRSLNEKETVMANVADGSDHVIINGQSKHVASYLKEFLFPPETFNQPVSVLSGGEKNRLLLAKLLAKPINLLVMDEPTNDLDLDTLDLLEKMLLEYTGTLIIISHDRAFINQVVSSVFVYEEGGFNEYIGGYDDYREQKKAIVKPVLQKAIDKPKKTVKLSFNEQRELTELPKQIETLEQKIMQAQLQMTETNFYQQDVEVIAQFNQQLAQDEALLKGYYQRWEELEDKGNSS